MKAVIIGSGNLATHLALALHDAGVNIVQVYSREQEHAQALALSLHHTCEAICDLSHITPNAHIYIIAIKDDAIARVAQQISAVAKNGIVIHTAGSVAMDVLKPAARHYGVLYPMQTFSKNREVSFSNVPCFIEASDAETLSAIKTLAEKICHTVQIADSHKRERLHLAAVFANNLTNHCYRMAERVLEEQDIDFKLLLPLITETARKVHTMRPKDAQTGPMVRYDVNVMNKQINMLKDGRQKEIYRLMAEDIHSDYPSKDHGSFI